MLNVSTVYFVNVSPSGLPIRVPVEGTDRYGCIGLRSGENICCNRLLMLDTV